MFSFLKSDPIASLRKKKAKLLEKAMLIQRSGDLKLYATKVAEIEQLENEIEVLKKQ